MAHIFESGFVFSTYISNQSKETERELYFIPHIWIKKSEIQMTRMKIHTDSSLSTQRLKSCMPITWVSEQAWALMPAARGEHPRLAVCSLFDIGQVTQPL